MNNHAYQDEPSKTERTTGVFLRQLNEHSVVSMEGELSAVERAQFNTRLFGRKRKDPRFRDRYSQIVRIGEGGMGVVYRAWDEQLERFVAIKVLRSEFLSHPVARKRLRREARALACLSDVHNVVSVYDCGNTEEGRFFIVMQYVEGPTLAQWLGSAPRPWRDIIRMFVRAGRGLLAAHRRALVHRDFKPQNVLLAGPDGSRPCVADFGLVRAMTKSNPDRTQLTVAGSAVGTERFMSPEQRRGLEVDARSDQFSFCVALYEALYGEPPFTGAELLEVNDCRTYHGRVPSVTASVPIRVWNVLRRGLAFDRERRWSSMEPLLRLLEQQCAADDERAGDLLDRIILSQADALRRFVTIARERATPETATELQFLLSFVRDGYPDAPGAHVANSELRSIHRRGVASKLWVARDLATGRAVATRVFDLNAAGGLRRFQRGLRVLQLVNEHVKEHDGLVRTRTVGEHELAYVVDLYERGDLTGFERLSWSFEQKIEKFVALCRTVQRLHDLGVIHCALSPEHVLVDNSDALVLTGFEHAVVAPALDVPDVPIPVPRTFFTAPDCVPERASPSTDVFGLGRLLLYLLSNRKAAALASYNTYHEALAELPEEYREVILRACDPEPSRRLESAERLARSLEMLRSPAAQLQRFARRAAHWILTSRLLLLGIVVALAINNYSLRVALENPRSVHALEAPRAPRASPMVAEDAGMLGVTSPLAAPEEQGSARARRDASTGVPPAILTIDGVIGDAIRALAARLFNVFDHYRRLIASGPDDGVKPAEDETGASEDIVLDDSDEPERRGEGESPVNPPRAVDINGKGVTRGHRVASTATPSAVNPGRVTKFVDVQASAGNSALERESLRAVSKMLDDCKIDAPLRVELRGHYHSFDKVDCKQDQTLNRSALKDRHYRCCVRRLRQYFDRELAGASAFHCSVTVNGDRLKGHCSSPDAPAAHGSKTR